MTIVGEKLLPGRTLGVMFHLENAQVIRNDCVGDGLYELECLAPQVAGNGKPGQFVHMEVKPCPSTSVSPLLRRPFSLYGVDGESGIISVLYRIRGSGTAILAQVRRGEHLSVLGPLGKGFSLPAKGSVALLVGGGMGIAPLVYLADRLVSSGCEVNVLYGAETASELVAQERLLQIGANCRVATMDGSRGHKGLVTDLLTSIGEFSRKLSSRFDQTSSSECLQISPDELNTTAIGRDRLPDMVYSCGPQEMMAVVVRFAKEHGIPGEVSMEAYMACGVGVCLGCACKLKSDATSYAKVCSDGPVFPLEQVGLRFRRAVTVNLEVDLGGIAYQPGCYGVRNVRVWFAMKGLVGPNNVGAIITKATTKSATGNPHHELPRLPVGCLMPSV